MQHKEIIEAINALITWFESQGIMPNDAAVIMIKLLAVEFYLKNQNDVISLQQAINQTKDLLTLEIAGLLRV